MARPPKITISKDGGMWWVTRSNGKSGYDSGGTMEPYFTWAEAWERVFGRGR